LDDELVNQLEEITPSFWNKFNQEYIQLTNGILIGLKNYLAENFRMEKDEFVKYCKEIENEVYITMRKDIHKKIEKLYDYMITNFKKDFFYDEGIPRIWNKMEESIIEKLFQQFKQKHFQTFEIFKKMTLVRNPMECNNT
jgi:hypothetical protein